MTNIIQYACSLIFRYFFGQALIALAIIFTIQPISSPLATAETVANTVTVTGTGSSVAEARKDALRQALQQTVPSFVSATRVVRDSEVLLDEILSASSGYVLSWSQHDLVEISGGYQVSVTIGVSAQEVEQTVELAIGQNVNLDGSRLFQEQQRLHAAEEGESLKESERIAIFDRVFQDFPHHAIQVEPLHARISEINDDFVEIDFLVSISDDFLANAESNISALATEECSLSNLSLHRSHSHRRIRDAIYLSEYFAIDGKILDTIFEWCLGVGIGRHNNQEDFDRVANLDLFCFASFDSDQVATRGLESNLRCYFLPNLDYCEQCYGFLINGSQGGLEWGFVGQFYSYTSGLPDEEASCLLTSRYGVKTAVLDDSFSGGPEMMREILVDHNSIKEILPASVAVSDRQQNLLDAVRREIAQRPLAYLFFGDYKWSKCYKCDGRSKHMLYFLQDRAIKITALFDTRGFRLADTSMFSAIIGFTRSRVDGIDLKGISNWRDTAYDGCQLLETAVLRGLAQRRPF